jgi:uroporphyrin-III C-methyltransferase / precorrin-2 dehydrogenase / sirohydrochlorin ferrochelatase
MNQLPLFLNLAGRKVILVGQGDAADAKRRLIERAGGICVGTEDVDARIAFIAMDSGAELLTTNLRSRGVLVNVADRPELCDFTTPSIVDRDPVLIAVSTGGASAGLAKAVRQRIEALFPQSLGSLATGLLQSRQAIRARWPDSNARRRAIDAALAGPLNPVDDNASYNVEAWLKDDDISVASGLIQIDLSSIDPDDLTLRQARLLGEADHIYHDANIPAALLNRARADAVRHAGRPPIALPDGLVIWLRLPNL